MRLPAPAIRGSAPSRPKPIAAAVAASSVPSAAAAAALLTNVAPDARTMKRLQRSWRELWRDNSAKLLLLALLLTLLGGLLVWQMHGAMLTMDEVGNALIAPPQRLSPAVLSQRPSLQRPIADLLQRHQQQQQQQLSPPLSERDAALHASMSSFDPVSSVVFAIPVGGRTKRAPQLRSIIETLVAGGAPTCNIFVVEDVLGRPGAVNDPDVAAVVAETGVRLVSSHVSRADMPENSGNFGIHLARHYKFMLDYLLVGPESVGMGPLSLPPVAGADAAAAGGAASRGPPFAFATIIEDDLVLSADFAKYFFAMARVMHVDPTLYCASAHQDNAFLGTSYEPPPGTVAQLDRLGFDFRRGNHFMGQYLAVHPSAGTSPLYHMRREDEHWLTLFFCVCVVPM
jgi:hypothetical protein